jgi:hypothetical protein
MQSQPFAQAAQISALRSSHTPLKDSLSSKNRVDTFAINLPNPSRFRASLTGISRRANVALELINANGRLATARPQGNAKRLNIAELAAGRYTLRAVLKQGQSSKYQLRFNSLPLAQINSENPHTIGVNPGANPGANPSSLNSPNIEPAVKPAILEPDLGGNSAAAASQRGKIGATPLTLSNALDSQDNADWYQFTVGEGAGSNSLKLSLNSLSGTGVYARVYNALDLNDPVGDVAFEQGKAYQSTTSLAVADGTYYVKLAPIDGNSLVNYNLNLSSTTIVDKIGNTPDTAHSINSAQPLTPGKSFTTSDFVGQGDIFDYYTFTTTQPTTLNIQFERLGTDHPERSRILYQLDRVGAPSVSPDWVNGAGASLRSQFVLTSPSTTVSGQLAPGTYSLQLKSFFHNGDNPYRMTISAV